MSSVANLFKVLFFGITLVGIKASPHKGHHHGHGSNLHKPPGLPQLPSLVDLSHSHGPGQAPHSHSGGSSLHTHPLAPPRTRFVISKLWNGSDDTVSQASDKGGDQVLITLEDNPFLQSIVMYIDAPFYDDPSPPNGKPGEAYFKV